MEEEEDNDSEKENEERGLEGQSEVNFYFDSTF
jgi:hypothetical protein